MFNQAKHNIHEEEQRKKRTEKNEKNLKRNFAYRRHM